MRFKRLPSVVQYWNLTLGGKGAPDGVRIYRH